MLAMNDTDLHCQTDVKRNFELHPLFGKACIYGKTVMSVH